MARRRVMATERATLTTWTDGGSFRRDFVVDSAREGPVQHWAATDATSCCG
jgi:hypothetical protein